MPSEASCHARNLLLTAMELLEEERALTAVQMITGALHVLDRMTDPMLTGNGPEWRPRIYKQPGNYRRSCA